MTTEQKNELIQKTANAARALKLWEECVHETRADVSTYYTKELRCEFTNILMAAIDGMEVPERGTK